MSCCLSILVGRESGHHLVTDQVSIWSAGHGSFTTRWGSVDFPEFSLGSVPEKFLTESLILAQDERWRRA